MICLTGDLHHQTLGTGNQKHCDLRETQVALLYLQCLVPTGIKVTFFISGLAFEQQWNDLEPIVHHPLVEFGGHNYHCFTPALPHRIFHKLTGNYNGPEWLQRWDAMQTIAVARRRTGRDIRLWRNHMYMHGPNTERVLAQCGIRLCSDGVERESDGPRWHPAGLFNLPINIIPDHEHLFHAERTPTWVARWQARYAWSDDYGPDSYPIDRWAEIVLHELQAREVAGRLSVLIIHPITMYLCDQFAAFRRICDFLGSCHTVHVSEVLEAAEARRRSGENLPP